MLLAATSKQCVCQFRHLGVGLRIIRTSAKVSSPIAHPVSARPGYCSSGPGFRLQPFPGTISARLFGTCWKSCLLRFGAAKAELHISPGLNQKGKDREMRKNRSTNRKLAAASGFELQNLEGRVLMAVTPLGVKFSL